MENNQSSKEKFLWNMLGSLSNALLSVFLLMLVTRLLSSSDSDLYSIAFAVGNLLSMVGLFQVRNIQSTDIERKYRFSEYLVVRIASNLVMVCLAIGYVLFNGFDSQKAILIILMTLYRVSESFSDLFQGLFQQRERLDIAGKSLFFRNVFILLSFSVTLIITHNLMISTLVWVTVSLLFVILYDVPKSLRFEKWFKKEYFGHFSFKLSVQLIRECFPLFLIGFFAIYIYNQPKYAIDSLMREGHLETGVQTIFNIIFMPTFVMNLLMLFFRPMLTQMSIFLYNGQIKQFKSLQNKTFLLLLALNIIILFFSALLAIPVLEVLYNIQLKEYWQSFMVLMLSGSIASLCVFLDNIITVLRYQKLLVPPYLLALVTALLVSKQFIIHYGMLGASLSFLATVLVWFICMCIIYLIARRNYFKNYIYIEE